MSLNRKMLSICFLALTIFSIFALSYTLYIVLETSRVLRFLEVSLSDVTIKENGSEAYFHLVICNPSTISLKVFFYETKIYFNDNYVDERKGHPTFQGEPLPLPSYAKTNLNITLSLNNQTSYSDGVWKLNLRFILETPLPQRGGYTTILEK